MIFSAYISDFINKNDLKVDTFNLIASGCGTGKSYFCAHYLLEHYPDVKPSEFLFLTSRAITVDQMSRSEGVDKFYCDNIKLVQYWNGLRENMEDIPNSGIQVMTYDKIINLLINQNSVGYKTLGKIKIVVVDECHTLFADTFINNMEVLKLWIRDMIYEKNKLFIGLTATPGIIHYYMKRWGVPINQVNTETLVNYKAKQLICTDYYTIPYLVDNNYLQGKTIIMCQSVRDCITLQNKLSNAAILVSRQNKNYYTPEMEEIRRYIVNQSTIPNTFTHVNSYTGKRERRPLNILISTTTSREGFTLLPSSGIQNVVCCFTDELNITQFVGRCRFNIKNLVIADMHHRSDNLRKDTYFDKCEKDYKLFIHNFENIGWFNSISHLVAHSWDQTKKIILGSDEYRFINYINSNWLVPLGCPDSDLSKYRIYRDEDKTAIVDMACDCKLFGLPRSAVTFNRVVDMLKNSLGYEIETNRFTLNCKKYTYKLILAFHESAITYPSKLEIS